MKKTLFTLILWVSLHSAFAQWSREWAMGYSHTNPSGKMKQNINQGNGITSDFLLNSPSQKFSIGAGFNYTIYGYDQSTQEYIFTDGTIADMDINVTNAFVNLAAVGRYYLVTGKNILPYLEAKAGYSWFRTDLNIYDPDDFDNCEPVETDLLQKDGTLIYSIGGGLQYDLSSVFKKLRKDYLLVNVSANYTRGGLVNYMNADAPEPHHGRTSNRTGNLEADFINTQTQVIHKHHVGYVYSSYAQMMDYRLSLAFRVSNKN